VIHLGPGNHGHVRHTGQDLAGITYRGVGAAVVSGGSTDEAAFYISNSDGVTVEGITTSTAPGRGIRAADCDNLTIRTVHLSGMRLDGILTAFCNNLVIDGVTADGSSQHVFEGDKTPHIIYVSCSSTGVTVTNCSGENASGCLLQFNGNAEEHSVNGKPFTGFIRQGHVSNVVGHNCGRDGAALFNLDRVQASIFDHVLGWWGPDWGPNRDNAGGIAVFENSTGVSVGRCTIFFPDGRGRFGMQVTGGCSAAVTRSIFVCGRGPVRQVGGHLDQDPASRFFEKEDHDAGQQLFVDPPNGKFELRDASLEIGWGKPADPELTSPSAPPPSAPQPPPAPSGTPDGPLVPTPSVGQPTAPGGPAVPAPGVQPDPSAGAPVQPTLDERHAIPVVLRAVHKFTDSLGADKHKPHVQRVLQDGASAPETELIIVAGIRFGNFFASDENAFKTAQSSLWRDIQDESGLKSVKQMPDWVMTNQLGVVARYLVKNQDATD
jgi:hypothetical protein